MSRRAIANPLALAVLSCLWERPMYPYEITTTLRERGKEDSIRLNFGSLYAVMKSLEKHGFIEESRFEREGNRPERTVYEITAEGRRETTEWLRDLLETPAKEYPAIEAGLSLMAILPPREVAGLLRTRAQLLTSELERREAVASGPEFAGLPEIFTAEFDYKLALLRAERDYIAAFADRLDRGEVGGQDVWARMHELLAQGRPAHEVQQLLAPHLPKEAATGTHE
ncbi:PadR family transcriptional regulator [Herbiconiux sp. CPCC 205763]|uniref:PadR family transcriptional regulator n=1 Tax=Herbiconiux aconitum TaxID=2970913 RepID=A0ABT2GR04_9MICO|nr:PadR family transcriptional regulator [Herbiconiux aconitum]MCS5718661.1 PadR family transcriptional regulator [Herbiconiux aconitum]